MVIGLHPDGYTIVRLGVSERREVKEVIVDGRNRLVLVMLLAVLVFRAEDRAEEELVIDTVLLPSSTLPCASGWRWRYGTGCWCRT
jgi:hypothetical protein